MNHAGQCFYLKHQRFFYIKSLFVFVILTIFQHLTSKETVLKVFYKGLEKFSIALHSFSLYLLFGSLIHFAFLHFYMWFLQWSYTLIFILFITLNFNVYIKVTCIIGIFINFLIPIFIIFLRIFLEFFIFLRLVVFFLWPSNCFCVVLMIFYTFLVCFLLILTILIYHQVLFFPCSYWYWQRCWLSSK